MLLFEADLLALLERDFLTGDADLAPPNGCIMLLAAFFIPLPAALIVFPILDTIPGFGLLDADPDLDLDCLD